MYKIVHISDLHFGALAYERVEPLLDYITTLRPDITVISGDITQRAKTVEFKEARYFFDRIPGQMLVVPGNHDVPWNIFSRFLQPYKKFTSIIHPDLNPTFVHENFLVIGVNSAHGLTTIHGRIQPRQVDHIIESIEKNPRPLTIVASHHPFATQETWKRYRVITGAQNALHRLIEHGIDVFLAGHFHEFSSTALTLSDTQSHKKSIFVHAGTTLSTRTRRGPPSFNILQGNGTTLDVIHMVWSHDKNQFFSQERISFQKRDSTWEPKIVKIANILT